MMQSLTMILKLIILNTVVVPLFFLKSSAQGLGNGKSSVVNHLKKYCYECHNPDDLEGDFSLTMLKWPIHDDDMAQRWQDVLDAMNSGEMPPKEEKQPTDEEFKQITSALTKFLEKARADLTSTGGKYVIRRMNKREYQNSIKHLFGININATKIPDDIRSMDHFDTAGSIQYFDAGLLDYYIHLGQQITEVGFKWSGKPYAKPKTKRYEAESTRGHSIYANRSHGKTGYYLYHGNRNSDTVSARLGDDPRGSYLFKVRGGLVGKNIPKVKHYLKAYGPANMNSFPKNIHGVIRLHGTEDQPGVSEVLVPRVALGGDAKPGVTFAEVAPVGPTNFGRWWPYYLNLIGVNKEPTVWIDYIDVEGPFYESQENVFGKLISPTGRNLGRPEKAKELIEEFAKHAFRGESPNSNYVDKVFQYYKSRIKAGLKYESAMAEAIGLVLASPSFLYMEERYDQGSGGLTSVAFANRLAYFLWSSPPDEELLRLANNRSLVKSDVLKKQVNRMLHDEKANSFYDGFISQWAELDRLEQIAVQWMQFFNHNDGIMYSQYREPIKFFEYIVKQNLNVGQIIHSDFAVVNHQLANFYGIAAPSSPDQFSPVKLTAKNRRGGILTQSAFLTIGSAGERTSPVIRGTLIMEKIFNDPSPPPPPNVPELGEASDKPISNRELVEMHREQKTCASCHDKIDPIGYGLENFNPIGEWRETEKVGDKNVPVHARAKLYTGEEFENIDQYLTLLKGHEPKLARNMIESLTGYGIGRPVEFSDDRDIDLIFKHAKADGFKLEDMIFHIVNSKTFKSK